MRNKNTLFCLLSGLLSILLLGCTTHIDEKQGAEIQLVPVTYTMSVKVQKGDNRSARQELYDYIDTHWGKVTTQNINLTWYSKTGSRLAENVRDYLLSKGINKSKISIEKTPLPEDTLFDVRLSIQEHKTVVEVCGYEKIGNYGVNREGCYADGARWQSMVNPERMLGQ